MYYQKYQDCGRDFSDFYVNTPRVEQVKNGTPSVIHLRWDPNIDMSRAMVEFYNYYSILPHQQARTFTTRGSFGIYPMTSPDMQKPVAGTVIVPPFAQRFRIRLDGLGPLVTEFVPVNNNGMYYYEAGRLFQLYNF
jgi:hypothetical protein